MVDHVEACVGGTPRVMCKCCAATTALLKMKKTPHMLHHPLQAAVSSHSFIGGLVSDPTNFAVCHWISCQICLPLRKWRPSAESCFNLQTKCPSALPTSLRTVEYTVCENHVAFGLQMATMSILLDVFVSGYCGGLAVSSHHVSTASRTTRRASRELATCRKALQCCVLDVHALLLWAPMELESGDVADLYCVLSGYRLTVTYATMPKVLC